MFVCVTILSLVLIVFPSVLLILTRQTQRKTKTGREVRQAPAKEAVTGNILPSTVGYEDT